MSNLKIRQCYSDHYSDTVSGLLSEQNSITKITNIGENHCSQGPHKPFKIKYHLILNSMDLPYI